MTFVDARNAGEYGIFGGRVWLICLGGGLFQRAVRLHAIKYLVIGPTPQSPHSRFIADFAIVPILKAGNIHAYYFVSSMCDSMNSAGSK